MFLLQTTFKSLKRKSRFIVSREYNWQIIVFYFLPFDLVLPAFLLFSYTNIISNNPSQIIIFFSRIQSRRPGRRWILQEIPPSLQMVSKEQFRIGEQIFIPSIVLARKLAIQTREILISQLKRYYKFKLNNPRFCLDLLPSNEQKVLISEIAIPLPERTADGCRVILFNTGKQWNPKIITGDEIFRATILLMEAAIIEAKTQVKKLIHILREFLFLVQFFNLRNLYQNTSKTEKRRETGNLFEI